MIQFSSILPLSPLLDYMIMQFPYCLILHQLTVDLIDTRLSKKHEIERLVDEMLKSGLIRSQSQPICFTCPTSQEEG
jgi:hypothetical protein